MAIQVLPSVVSSRRTESRAVAASSSCGEQVAAVRLQTAVVRTLLDEVDRLAPPAGGSHASSEQVAEEIARLGCRLIDLATSLTMYSD